MGLAVGVAWIRRKLATPEHACKEMQAPGVTVEELELFVLERGSPRRDEMAFLKNEPEGDLAPLNPVGLREYEAAKSHLSKNSGFDFDTFLEEIRAGTLFDEPLGPSAHCLSVSQIAECVEAVGSRGESVGEKAVNTHLGNCDVCRENVAAYRTLAARHPVEVESEPVLAGQRSS
jgi:hypothetical protein